MRPSIAWRTRSSTGCCEIRHTISCRCLLGSGCAQPKSSSNSLDAHRSLSCGPRLPFSRLTARDVSSRANCAGSNLRLQNWRWLPCWLLLAAPKRSLTPPTDLSRKEGPGHRQVASHAPSMTPRWGDESAGACRASALMAGARRRSHRRCSSVYSDSSISRSSSSSPRSPGKFRRTISLAYKRTR